MNVAVTSKVAAGADLHPELAGCGLEVARWYSELTIFNF
jgi:hypothetical protein